MLLRFVMVAALGAACAGCSARTFDTALAADNPANPDAASVPFVRPVNVLAGGGVSAASNPSKAMPSGEGAMPGMDMSGAMAGRSGASAGDGR